MGPSDVDGWDFFNNDDRYDAAIGAMYGGDGSMDCKNGDNISRAVGAVGTSLKAREAFCKMKNAKYGGENVNSDSAYRVCVSGSTPDAQWDDDGSDNLVKQYESFRDNMGFKDPGLDDATQYMRAYSTLINGCNLKAEETVYDSWDKAVEGAKGESEIMPFVTMEKKGKNIVLQYRTGIGSRGDSSVILVATTGLYEPARGGTHGGISAAKYPRTMRSCDQLSVDTNTYAAKYARYVNTNGYTEGGTPDNPKDNPDGGDPKSSCSIEGGLGWILCPVMTTLATINDTAFKSLDGFLEVNSSTFSNSSLKSAWESFRDLANIAFIGAFLVVVYSQITGAGITNYGIKKLLPKIIIAAILVNISFWICALAVDISNVLGASLKSLFEGLVGGGGSGAPPETWSNIVGGLLTAVVSVALIIALILAPTVLLAVAVVLIILIARQAFVILLIVLSPLAFVAYLLPNTNAWFTKWWKAFTTTLMVYPVVGAIFGASTLASNILAKADGTEMKLAALAVLGIPLFAVPAVLKGAMSAAGTIGAKLAGLQDRANKRGSSAIGSRVKKGYENSAFARGRALRKQAKEQYKTEKFAGAMSGSSRRDRIRQTMARGVSGSRLNPFSESRQRQQKGIDRATTGAVNEALNKEIGFTSQQLSEAADSHAAAGGGPAEAHLAAAYKKAVIDKDAIAARAAVRALTSRGGGGVAALHEATAELHDSDHMGVGGDFDAKTQDLTKEVRQEVRAQGDNVKSKDSRLTHWAEGKGDGGGTAGQKDTLAHTRILDLKDETIASQNYDSLTSSGVGKATAERILDSPELSARIKTQREREFFTKAAGR